MKVMVEPIIANMLGTLPKDLERKKLELNLSGRINIMQTTSFLR